MAATLDERLARLEQLVDDLIRKSQLTERRKDWRSTVGMFDGDPIMKETIEEGRRIREADRQAARDEFPS